MICSSCDRIFRRCKIDHEDHHVRFDSKIGLDEWPTIREDDWQWQISDIYDQRASCSFCARIWFYLRTSGSDLRTDETTLQIFDRCGLTFRDFVLVAHVGQTLTRSFHAPAEIRVKPHLVHLWDDTTIAPHIFLTFNHLDSIEEFPRSPWCSSPPVEHVSTANRLIPNEDLKSPASFPFTQTSGQRKDKACWDCTGLLTPPPEGSCISSARCSEECAATDNDTIIPTPCTQSLQDPFDFNCQYFRERVPLVQRWLSECEAHSHDELFSCPNSKSIGLPTRLIHVGDTDSSLRLCMGKGLPESIKYATLSHKWGNSVTGCLVRANHDKYLDRIPRSELPKTFKDAITVCYELGINYLWIDSLCITQDCGTDWNHEAPRMNIVYHNSYLNIAASAAQNCDGGLFRPNMNHLLSNCVINTGNGHDYVLHAAPAPNSDIDYVFHLNRFINDEDTSLWDYQILAASPTLRRAWVVQEIFLAPKTLHFSETQLWWQCKSFRASERHPLINQEPGGQTLGMYGAAMLKASAEHSHIHDLPPHVEKLDRLWAAITAHYTSADISFATDRPVALMGIVAHFQAHYQNLGHDTNYVAGTWTHMLPKGLLWAVDQDGAMYSSNYSIKANKQSSEQSSPTRIASTWSWLSAKRPTTALSNFMAIRHDRRPAWSGMNHGCGSLLDILSLTPEVSDDPQQEETFARIVITMRAALVTARLSQSQAHSQHHVKSMTLTDICNRQMSTFGPLSCLFIINSRNPQASFYGSHLVQLRLDDQATVGEGPMDVALVPVWQSSPSNRGTWVSGLVLKQTTTVNDDDMQFERVGAWHFNIDESFPDPTVEWLAGDEQVLWKQTLLDALHHKQTIYLS